MGRSKGSEEGQETFTPLRDDPKNLPELKEMAGNGKPTKGLPAGGEKPLLRPKPPPERREGGQGKRERKETHAGAEPDPSAQTHARRRPTRKESS